MIWFDIFIYFSKFPVNAQTYESDKVHVGNFYLSKGKLQACLCTVARPYF